MKIKTLLCGVAMVACVIFTSFYIYDCHQDFIRQKSDWNDVARDCFWEAVDIEVNKRSDIPVRVITVHEPDSQTLYYPIPDSVTWVGENGEQKYAISPHKYQNSYIKDAEKRIILSFVLEANPIKADVLNECWDSLLLVHGVKPHTRVRCAVTNLLGVTDTIFSEANRSYQKADSLLSIYMGHRCEVELTGYISYSVWNALTIRSIFLYLLVLGLGCMCIVFRGRIEQMIYRLINRTKNTQEVVNSPIHPLDASKMTGKFYELGHECYFESAQRELYKHGTKVRKLPPMVAELLQLFLEAPAYRLTENELMDAIWVHGEGTSDKLHQLIKRLRKVLEEEIPHIRIENEGRGIYALKSPISSINSSILTNV